MKDFVFNDDVSNLLKLAELKEFGDGWSDCDGSHLAYFREGTVQRVLAEWDYLRLFEVVWDSQGGDPLIEFCQNFFFNLIP